MEEFEEVIEDWYRNHQEEDLTEFLCTNHVLKGKDTSESGQGQRVGTGRPRDMRGPNSVPGPQLPSPSFQLLCLPTGCLAERWSGKKGDTAALGGKKAKKKDGRAKATSSSNKQRKALGGLEEDPNTEDEEEGGIQKASPLPHSPPDEL